jgi:hypothetical protein
MNINTEQAVTAALRCMGHYHKYNEGYIDYKTALDYVKQVYALKEKGAARCETTTLQRLGH